MSTFPHLGVVPVPLHPDGRRAEVSSGWEVRSDGRLHRGSDILYRRKAGESARAPNGAVPPGVSVNEPGGWYMPDGVPALSPWSGVVTVSEPRDHPDGYSRGWAVRVQHSERWATQIGHIKKGSQRVKVGDRVGIGEPLGEIGGSRDNEGLKHVHLGLYKDGVLVDPEPYVNGWQHVAIESGAGASVALGLAVAWLVAS